MMMTVAYFVDGSNDWIEQDDSKKQSMFFDAILFDVVFDFS